MSIIKQDNVCHMCGADTESDFICEDCGELVCEDCCVPYTIHNPIDFILCNFCGEDRQEMSIQYYEEQQKKKDKADAIRKERNRKARIRYHSPEQKEKRRQKKRELLLKRIAEERESRIRVAKIMGDLFK